MRYADQPVALPLTESFAVTGQLAIGGASVEGGVVRVVSEDRARSPVAPMPSTSTTHVSADDLAGMSAGDHRRAFTAFVAGLLSDFDRHLDVLTGDVGRGAVTPGSD